MFTRLAFAVAANLDPEILIIDEVLSVGDAAFQKKCLVKIRNLMKSGRTVLFVSHNIGSVAELCTCAILLHKGRILKSGSTSEIIEQYAKLIAQDTAERGIRQDATGYHADDVSITAVKTRKASGAPDTVFDVNDEVVVEIDYEVHASLETLQLVGRTEPQYERAVLVFRHRWPGNAADSAGAGQIPGGTASAGPFSEGRQLFRGGASGNDFGSAAGRSFRRAVHGGGTVRKHDLSQLQKGKTRRRDLSRNLDDDEALRTPMRTDSWHCQS